MRGAEAATAKLGNWKMQRPNSIYSAEAEWQAEVAKIFFRSGVAAGVSWQKKGAAEIPPKFSHDVWRSQKG